MRCKRFLAFLLVAVSLAGAFPAVHAEAVVSPSIQPKWMNVGTIDLRLTYSGSTANCKGTVAGLSGTTWISATFTLEMEVLSGNYILIDSWPASSSSSTLNWNASASGLTPGYNYRLTVTGTVTRNGSSEPFSSFVEKTL